MERQPLKRSDDLVLLSRDHHGGLLFCWKIRQGLSLEISRKRIADYARFFWKSHLQAHFREEEILLFNQLKEDLTLRAKAEHQYLRNWFLRLDQDEEPSAAELLVMSTALNNHIRFEEREVFPLLEQRLDIETLAGIRQILTSMHQQPFADNYPDEFWVKEIRK